MSEPAAVAPAVGERVPPYTIALTLQRLVMEAAANRDFAAIHYDPGAARDSGAPGVYMNTTFIETLIEAALRTWAGPGAWIAMIEFTMKDFNCAGDEVSATGQVAEVRDEDGTAVADLDVWVESHRGRTVVGRATVRFGAPA